MLAYDSFQMNYHNMNPASLQPSTSSISLPPISSIDFRVQAAHHSPPEVVQPLPPPPPPPRHLPPLSYYNGGRQIPQEPQYVQQQSFYRGMQPPSPYNFGPGTRVPLPSTTDPSLMAAPTRHKTKEVKRRTKTGCLTCRKRRIKCDEGRPECRNCMKSKRQCLGYDPVFQSQGPQSLHPAPASTVSNNSTTATASSSTSQPHRYTVTPSSPFQSNHTNSLPHTSPHDHTEYSFSKPPDLLPHINQPYRMDNTSQSGLPSYTSASRPRHSIEEICTISGTKVPSIPAIPQDSVPNLDSIRKVYDIAFAHGLDKFLETSQQWFSNQGFELLAGNRALLGLVLAYLTLVSSNHDAPIDSNDTLSSQEARVTWGLLSLCVRPDHHGDAEADNLARRFRILESLLTGEPLTSTPASMSEFVHQEPEPEPEPKQEAKQSTFETQLARRSEGFWRTLESIATAQGRGTGGIVEIKERLLPHARALLDGRESRDVIYSAVMLGWGKNGDPSSERELAKRFLQTECSGRATELVCKTMAGMALRAFDS